MNVWKNACKVTVSLIGLPADCTLEKVKLFDRLTPQIQQLMADTKKFGSYCSPRKKTSLSIAFTDHQINTLLCSLTISTIFSH